MVHNPFAFSLKKKLIITYLLLSVISITVVATISFEFAEKLLGEKIMEQFEAEAKYRSETIKHIWELRVQQIGFLTKNDVIHTVLQKANEGKLDDSDRSILGNLIDQAIREQWPELKLPDEDEYLYQFVILDKGGEIVSSRTAALIELASQRFQRDLSGPFYTFAQVDGLPSLVITVPIVNNDDSEILGMVVVSRDMTLANDVTLDRENLGDSGEVYLVNREKFMITESRFLEDASFNQKVDTFAVNKCFENDQQVIGVYDDYRGIPVFGVSQCEKDLGFVLLAEIDEAEMNSPITSLQHQYIIIGAIITTIVVIITVLISNNISKPILKLTEYSKKIADGSITSKTDDAKKQTRYVYGVQYRTITSKIENIESQDEIGKLYEAFKRMVSNLTELIDEKQQLNQRLQQANEQLRQKDRLKDEFISIASHELKNPIQPILGFATLAKRGKIPNNEAWDGVLQHARHLRSLSSDILDVSRIESGTLSYNFKKTILEKSITQAINSVKPVLDDNLPIRTKLDDDVEINADEERLSQVFTNILGNAIKFTKKGSITIESQRIAGQNEVQIKISDTGPGIPTNLFPTLFGKFSTTSVGGGTEHGTGLGLFISKAIIEAHGGSLSAYNNERGATFVIRLPLLDKITLSQ